MDELCDVVAVSISLMSRVILSAFEMFDEGMFHGRTIVRSVIDNCSHLLNQKVNYLGQAAPL